MSVMRMAASIFGPFAFGIGVMVADAKLATDVLEWLLGNSKLGALALGSALLTLGVGLLLSDETGLHAYRRSRPKIVYTLTSAACFLLGAGVAGLCGRGGAGYAVTSAILFSGYFAALAVFVDYQFREVATAGTAPLPAGSFLSEKARRRVLALFVITAGLVNFWLVFREMPFCSHR